MRFLSLKNSTLTDAELALGCSQHNPKHQELLYKRYFSFAMSFGLRYTTTREDALEVVNDSFLKAFNSISDYDTYRPFKGWLRKIIINTAVDNYRRNNKHQSVIPIDTIPDTETDEPDVSINLDADDILQLFNQLPAPYRVTFNLYEIEGYSHEEIGEMLGIATSTSRANLTRAKKILKELYFAMYNTTKSCHEAV